MLKKTIKMDFKDIVDIIFNKKKDYYKILDSDKEKNFFIINRKFSRKYPEMANYFNNKNIDKSSALDKWYYFFINQHGIPAWYWGNKKNKKNNDKINGYILIERENLTKNDLIFINKYYSSDLKNEIKKIKKYY
jgi:hypothetical protein